jgi:hypothetical protein
MAEQKETEVWVTEETEEPEEMQQDVITYKISYYPADFTLKGYLDKWDDGQLIIPDFQRNYVWDQVKASKLIESFLLGLPVPGVFLYKERYTNKLVVIDGQQRILSAIRYFKNAFDEKIFRLKNAHPKWDGKTYHELDESDRYQLNDTVLRATVVQQLDPDDDSSIYHIFERLNTGGINLNPMEIRKCVYFGSFFSLLEDLNKDDAWRQLLGKAKEDKRLRDVELILRVLALRDGWRAYEKPMKQFLNKYMAEKKKLDTALLERFLNETRVAFEDVCLYVYDQLGEKPFHLRGRLNYAVMDSTMAMSFDALQGGIANLKERFMKLLEDDRYIDSTTRNTSDDSTVKTRFALAQEYLAG